MTGLLSGEFHLTGAYQRPMGFGGMTIDNAVAYGEPLDKTKASLRFDGLGIRLDGINIDKDGGDDHRRRVCRLGLDLLVQRRRPAHSRRSSRASAVSRGAAVGPGRVHGARATGRSTSPRNDFKFRVNDLFVGEEGVGQVSGSLTLRGKELSGDSTRRRRGWRSPAPGASR